MRPKILAIMPPGDDVLLHSLAERLQERLAAYDFHAVTGMTDAAPYASEAEIIIAFFLSDEIVRQAARLKWVQCVISGVDGVLTPSLPPDVLVTNTRGTHGPPVSEAALGAMLALSRGLPQLVQAQQKKIWNPLTPSLLYGKTVGIVGVGVIAEALAQRSKAMGMNVVGVTATPRNIPGFDEMRLRSELAVVAADFDYMVVISPLTEETRGMVNESVLRAMSDRWLGDLTLFGSAREVREGFEAWLAAGVKTPILVPSSTSGGQIKAIEELLAAFA